MISFFNAVQIRQPKLNKDVCRKKLRLDMVRAGSITFEIVQILNGRKIQNIKEK